MMIQFVKKVLLILCLGWMSFSWAEGPVKFTMESEVESLEPGSPFWVALNLKIEEGWHAYWKNPGDSGMAPQIAWALPEGLEVQALEWPSPERFSTGEVEAYGYSDDLTILARILPSQSLSMGSKMELSADVRWVVCSSDTCLPGNGEGKIVLSAAEKSVVNEHLSDVFEKAKSKLPSKTKHIQTKRKDALIESVVEALDAPKEDLKTAFFIPENPDSIAGKNDVLVAHDESHPGRLVLTFKEGSAGKETIKGVIIAGKLGYEVEIPSHKDTDEIAYSEKESVLPIQKMTGSSDLNSLSLAIAFAFLGGMILNLMPCVLPVVSLKVLSFVNLSKESSWATLRHGLLFFAGVLVSFWALASILIVLQTYGHAIGWGFQLQEPLFVAVLAALMLIFSLSLFGLFEMGAVFASWAGEKEMSTKESRSGAFFSGVLATAVATPCTGPFLGSAIGYAFTLPPIKTLAIFTFLGTGMAFPYVLLTFFPRWLKFIPKPGPWMETFKQMMGFMMLLAVIWLAWVFGSQTGVEALSALLIAFFIIAVGAWVLGRWSSPIKARRTRIISLMVALAFFAGSVQIMRFASSQESASVHIADEGWESFSLERISELRAKNIPVFIDFTAKWCLICQTNHLVLSKPDVAKALNAKGVVKMKADWTKNDPVITQELKKFGRSGVPLYVLYTGDGEPQILPQVLTPDNVIESLKKIQADHVAY